MARQKGGEFLDCEVVNGKLRVVGMRYVEPQQQQSGPPRRIECRWMMRDRLTGEVREGGYWTQGSEVEDTVSDLLDGVEFQWLENNWSCDCNRVYDFYGREEGERIAREAGQPENLCAGLMPDGDGRFELLRLWFEDSVVFEGSHYCPRRAPEVRVLH